MLSWISRSLIKKRPLNRMGSAINHVTHLTRNSPLEQVEYLNCAIQEKVIDWPSIKSQILSQPGYINQKNYEGVLLKVMVSDRQLDAALSFANHIKSNNNELTLGFTNGLLGLYSEIGKTRKLTEEEKLFIRDAYKKLYEKYKVLDFATCEKLLRALCVIDEWEKALWVLEDIHLSSIPSHAAFSILIGTLFRNNKKKKAIEIISESIKHKRPLQFIAFEEWINFILRKYKERKTILKHLDEIHDHIEKNCAVVDESTATKLQETYSNLGWEAELTKIRKTNGECIKCKEKLECLTLTDGDFKSLQHNVKEKLIVGSDLFLKSSPEELKRFLCFVEQTAPYDIVIDALNVAYAVGKGSQADRLRMLFSTVDHFKAEGKKILVLGRKHMLRWDRGSIQRLKNSTYTFFTDDISQDDPYFITAAILSGPQTDIVSKDLLRTHQFNLQDQNLKLLFKKWQWQHQWMIFLTHNNAVKIQPPLSFTPCVQRSKNSGSWHLPYQSEATKAQGQVNDGTPDLNYWLCIRRRANKLH